MKKTLFLTILLASATVALKAQWNEERNYFYSEGMRSYNSSDPERSGNAVYNFKRCIALNYLDTMAHYYLAGTYAQMGRSKRDTAYYDLALKEYAISDSIMPAGIKRNFYVNRATTQRAYADFIFIQQPQKAMGLYQGAKKDYEVYNTIFPGSASMDIEQVQRQINHLKYDVGIKD